MVKAIKNVNKIPYKKFLFAVKVGTNRETIESRLSSFMSSFFESNKGKKIFDVFKDYASDSKKLTAVKNEILDFIELEIMNSSIQVDNWQVFSGECQEKSLLIVNNFLFNFMEAVDLGCLKYRWFYNDI
jgi:hypothetical protein